MIEQIAPWVVAVVALAGGFPVAAWLRQTTYRKPDEVDLPSPGQRRWVPPVLAITAGLLTWRVWSGADPMDPGFGEPRGGLVRAVVLVTLLVAALASVCLAAMDFDVHRLPDRLMWPTMGALLGGLGLAAIIALDWGVLLRVVLAGLVCGGGYLLLALLSLARGSLAIGLGDVKLAAVLGMALGWFGWGPVLVGMYAGFLVGGLFAIALLVTRRVGWSGSLAYGPPMMVGALIGLLLPPGGLGSLF